MKPLGDQHRVAVLRPPFTLYWIGNWRSHIAHHAAAYAMAATIAFALLRVLLVTRIGLGVDEFYASSMARVVSLSYFDDPPLHFWIAHFALGLFGEPRLGASPLF